MHWFHKFTLAWNSTCFGQFLCPSSGVYSVYIQQWHVIQVCRQLSKNLYDIYHCWMYSGVPCQNKFVKLRGGADKSLARLGRTQATATKLGTYSKYSPRTSIHFLAHCSTFASHSKKFRILFVQPSLRSRNDFCVGRKMATFRLFFQSREQVVVRRGQIRRIGWVIKTLEAEVGQVLLSFKCPVSRGHCRARTRPP